MAADVGALRLKVKSGPTSEFKLPRDGKHGNSQQNQGVGAKSRTTNLGPFGEVIRQTGPMAKLNPIRWSTKYQDDESDLLYYGYRYYIPSTGRWPNRDPMNEQGGLNLYGFVGNNSVSAVDYLGYLTFRFQVIVGHRVGYSGKWSQCKVARGFRRI